MAQTGLKLFLCKPLYLVSNLSFGAFSRKTQGRSWYDDACSQTCQPESHAWDLHGGRRELTPTSCSLAHAQLAAIERVGQG